MRTGRYIDIECIRLHIEAGIRDVPTVGGWFLQTISQGYSSAAQRPLTCLDANICPKPAW